MVPQSDPQSQPKSILDQPVSVFLGAKSTDVAETVSLGEVLHRIQDGTYRASIAHVREQKPRSAAAYRKAKEQLCAFTPCCALRTRKQAAPWREKLVSTTGLVHFDFDHVPEASVLKERLASNPATVFAFISPGEDGVKVGIAAEGITNADTYKYPWQVVLRRLKKAYPDLHISEDEHVKFLHALCFVSDDPAIYINPGAVPLPLPVQTPDEEAPLPEMPAQESGDFDPVEVTRALTQMPSESYDAWILVGQALHSTGHPLARGLWDWWSSRSRKYQQTAQDSKWKSFTKDGGRTLGDLYTLAHTHGWRRFKPPAADAEERANGHSTADTPTRAAHGRALVRGLDDDPERDVRWQWEPYMAYGKLHLLDGDPGTGKTLLMCAIAASLSQAGVLPDQDGKCTVPIHAPQRSLFVAMEDNLADTIRPRVRKAGGDVSMIKVLNEIEDAQGHVKLFTLEHLPLLEEAIQEHQPSLVYIDSLQGVMGARVDIHRANQVLPLLHALADLAERYDVAVVATRHPSKPGQNMARLIHRGMGSQAFIGTARLALYVDDHPTDRSKSILVQSKSNAGHPAMTQVFSKARGVFEWCGVTRLNAAILAGGGSGPDPRAVAEACIWLEGQLYPGCATPAKKLQDGAKDEDLNWRTVNTAKKMLGIQATRLGDQWFWTLPVPIPYDYTSLHSLQTLPSLHSLQTLHSSTKTTTCGMSEYQGTQECPESKERKESKECKECKVVTDAGVNAAHGDSDVHADRDDTDLIDRRDLAPPPVAEDAPRDETPDIPASFSLEAPQRQDERGEL
jgi:DNA repair protein RadA/Sms